MKLHNRFKLTIASALIIAASGAMVAHGIAGTQPEHKALPQITPSVVRIIPDAEPDTDANTPADESLGQNAPSTPIAVGTNDGAPAAPSTPTEPAQSTEQPAQVYSTVERYCPRYAEGTQQQRNHLH